MTQLPVLGAVSCMRFAYHMFGSGIGTLSVYQSTDHSYPGSQQRWTERGNKGNVWRTAMVQIDFGVVSTGTVTEVGKCHRRNRRQVDTLKL